MEITVILAFSILLILILLIKNTAYFGKQNKNEAGDIIIAVKGHKDDIELVLREAIYDVRWKNKHKNVICLDYGMDEETKKICKLMSKDYDFIHIKDCTDDKKPRD